MQHIYVSLRAPIAEGLHLIDVTITSNGRVFSSPTRINAPFLSVDGQEFSELVGQFVVVPEPADVLDAPAVIRARVELNDVEFGQVERSGSRSLVISAHCGLRRTKSGFRSVLILPAGCKMFSPALPPISQFATQWFGLRSHRDAHVSPIVGRVRLGRRHRSRLPTEGVQVGLDRTRRLASLAQERSLQVHLENRDCQLAGLEPPHHFG